MVAGGRRTSQLIEETDMTKKELVEAVAAGTSGALGDPLTKSDCEKVIDATVEVITRE